MATDQPISEDELHAYVDGDLAPARRVEIALYLAGHPGDAARLEVFRAQREAIHALFDEPLDQPVPQRLLGVVRRYAARRARRRRAAGMTLGVIIAGLVLATGRALVFDDVVAREDATITRHAPAHQGVPVIRPLGPLRPQQRNFDI